MTSRELARLLGMSPAAFFHWKRTGKLYVQMVNGWVTSYKGWSGPAQRKYSGSSTGHISIGCFGYVRSERAAGREVWFTTYFEDVYLWLSGKAAMPRLGRR